MGPLTAHHASAPTEGTPTVDKGSHAERRPGGFSLHHIYGQVLSLGMCKLLEWRAHPLLTSGPEVASKDLMHQGSSLCLPIQPERKARL